MTDELLLTYDEAARIAHVSPETIRYWVKTGRLARKYSHTSARSGRPYGRRVSHSELVAALPANREKQMKDDHPGKLLTVREVAAALKISKHLAYILIRRYELEKFRIDGWTFMVDGEELHRYLEDDPTYYYLLHK